MGMRGQLPQADAVVVCAREAMGRRKHGPEQHRLRRAATHSPARVHRRREGVRHRAGQRRREALLLYELAHAHVGADAVVFGLRARRGARAAARDAGHLCESAGRRALRADDRDGGDAPGARFRARGVGDCVSVDRTGGQAQSEPGGGSGGAGFPGKPDPAPLSACDRRGTGVSRWSGIVGRGASGAAHG